MINLTLLDDLLAAEHVADYLHVLATCLFSTAKHLNHVVTTHGDFDLFDDLIEKRNALLAAKWNLENGFIDHLSNLGRLN